MRILFVFISFLCFSSSIFSAEDLNLINEKNIEKKIDQLGKNKGIDEATKSELSGSYNKTLSYMEQIKSNKEKISYYKTIQIEAPKKIKQLTKQLKKLTDNQKIKKNLSDTILLKSVVKLSFADVEHLITESSIKLASLTAKQTDIHKSLNDTEQSLPRIREELIKINLLLEKKIEERDLIPDNIPQDIKQASQWRINTQISLLRSQIEKLNQELASQPIRLKLFTVKENLANFQVRKSQVQYELLQKKMALKRDFDVKKSQTALQVEKLKAKGKYPLVNSLAQKNIQLNEQIIAKVKQLSYLQSHDDDIHESSKKLQKKQLNMQRKLEIIGLKKILGQILYSERKLLPNSHVYEQKQKERQQLIASASFQLLQNKEELDQIVHKEDYLAHLLIAIPVDVQQQIHSDMLELIKARHDLLKKAILINEKYLKAMGDIVYADKLYYKIVEQYRDFLNKNLFWMRSTSILSLEDLKRLPEQFIYFLTPETWLNFFNSLLIIISTSVYIQVYLLLICVFLLRKQHIKKLLINIGLKTKRISTDRLLHTFKAIFFTFLLAVPLPGLLLLLSWMFFIFPDASDLIHAVAMGLKFIAFPLFWLRVFNMMCLPGGVAEVHFKWSDDIVNGLRRNILGLQVTFLPLLFITSVLIFKNENMINAGLVRLSLIVTILVITVFFYHLINPKTGLLNSVAIKKPDSIFARFQTLIFIIGLLIVLVLISLTFTGYVYTAAYMTKSLIYTIWLIFTLVFLQQMTIRWLLLVQRRYALARAYEKHQERIQKKIQANDSEKADPEFAIEFEEPEIDMVSLSADSIKLVNMMLIIFALTLLSIIWAEVLSTLVFFDKFILWHHTIIVDGTEQSLPVTIWDLGLAILVMIFTIISAKRLPAIIEIILLQSSSMNLGSRYTITTLVNYSIIGLGIFAVFNLLGAEWARLQWLFAALSVGIGFGLQEIVANFISGIILLFERPIRVGDYVSVGDNEGVVSKIRIRATTILTKDRKELLVPNKEFITGQLLNWSLSDPTTRLIIPIGVAYGSDIPLARKLILQVAKENKEVLIEPNPRVLFYNFGDNTLDLQLRCFIGDIDYRLKAISDINEAINEKFNTAHINIAFPQRDVHLDINQPIDIVLKK